MTNIVIEKYFQNVYSREPIKLNLEQVNRFINNKTVIISGGGGTIGSELCRQITNFNPNKIIILDNNENGAFEVQQEVLRKYNYQIDIELVLGSVQDKKRMDQVFHTYKPDVFFHAAAHKHVPILEFNPFEAVKNNIFGTQNCIELANKYNLDSFILISTDKAVNPASIMGVTKRIGELICLEMNKSSSTKISVVRFGNVLDSNGSVIPLFRKQLKEGGPIIVTHPDVTRYFMTVDEAVQLILQSGAIAQGGEIFVLDMGEPIKIDDIARDFIKFNGYDIGDNMEITYSGLRPGEKLYEELYLQEEELVKTSHERIFIGKNLNKESNYNLYKQLENLRIIVEKEDINGLKQTIKQLVPTYKLN